VNARLSDRSRGARLLLFLALVSVPSLARAQSPKDTICSTFEEPRIHADQSKTLGQVQFEAKNRLRAKLLNTFSTRIQSTQEMNRFTSGDSAVVRLQSSISAETAGNIVRDWSMKYYGCATAAERGDPAFEVKARLDKTPASYAYAGASRLLRDTIVVTVSTSQAAYLTTFVYGEDDSLFVIYPSAAIGHANRTLLMRGDTMTVPPAGSRVRVTMDSTAQLSRQTMIVVATKREYPLPASLAPDNPNAFWRLSWQEYLNWYNRIPMDEKTLIKLPFTIEKVIRR
jgi:hypothetical protein